VSLVGQQWPSHVGHQQECVFPMLQLLQSGNAQRMFYLVAGVKDKDLFTPFIIGLLNATGHALPHKRVSSGASMCFENVAFCFSPSSRWISMRESKLVPQHSGQLVAPTRSQAHRFAKRVWEHCNVSPRNAGAPLQTGLVLLRNTTHRTMLNVEKVVSVLRRVLLQVSVTYINSLDFCTQVRWLHADVVVSVHGSHLVSQAFMRPGTHLIEILPYLYEQDYDNAGCSFRHRPVLVGSPPPRANETRDNARLARQTKAGRSEHRRAGILVPIAEFEMLLARTVTRKTAWGR